MLIYGSIIIIILILYCLIFYNGDYDSDKKRKTFLVLTFAILFFIMGFRSETVGTDTKLYCNIFENIKKMSMASIINGSDTSILYIIYNKIVGLFSNSRTAIITTNSFIICSLTGIFIYNNSKRNILLPTLLFLCLYHFFSAMNISRQYIAVMIVANSLYWLKEKRKLYFLLSCLVATLVHNTAIVSLILFPLFYIKLNAKNILIYITTVAILGFSLDKILILFSTIFPHYSMYFGNNFLTEIGQNRKIIITLLYIVFELIMLCLLKSKDISNKDKENLRLYVIINSLAIILGLISLRVMLFSRMEIYFSIFSIIYIPYIVSFFKDKQLITFFLVLIMFIPMVVQLNSNNSEVLPYKNRIFTKET